MKSIANPEEKLQSEVVPAVASLHLACAVDTGSHHLGEYKAEDTIWVLKTNKQNQKIKSSFTLHLNRELDSWTKSGNGGVWPSPLNMTDDTSWDFGQ